MGSSSSLYKDFRSTQPRPGMVSTRYRSAGSSAVCSYPWGPEGPEWETLAGGLCHQLPLLIPGHPAYLVIPGRDAVQALILLQQVDGLAQETEEGGDQEFTPGKAKLKTHRPGGQSWESRVAPPALEPLPSHSNLLPPTGHLPTYLLTSTQPSPPQPSHLSSFPPEISPRHFTAFFRRDPAKPGYRQEPQAGYRSCSRRATP